MTAQDITELLDTILSLHKPVALVDEIGDFTIPLQAAANPLLKVFTIAAATAGMQVARYLRNLGHRRIAYITPYSDQQWSQRRCRGLIDIFEKAGMVPDRVPAAAQSGVSVHTAGPWDVSDPKARKLIESFLSAYERGIHAGIRSFLLQAVDFDGGLFRAYEGMRVALVQQFERVLNDRHVSAWVLPNDVCAYFAHDFLTSRGVAVPRAMSVIGFDDTKMSVVKGLSSYNFAVFDIMQKAVAFIRDPRNSFFSGKTVLECEGMVVARESSGRVRRTG
jgi:DNA-binding LacI/PurR family transcriptional regulator